VENIDPRMRSPDQQAQCVEPARGCGGAVRRVSHRTSPTSDLLGLVSMAFRKRFFHHVNRTLPACSSRRCSDQNEYVGHSIERVRFVSMAFRKRYIYHVNRTLSACSPTFCVYCIIRCLFRKRYIHHVNRTLPACSPVC